MPGESIHDLQLKGLMLIQKEKGFRFGMDAVLLSDFCFSKPGDKVADFGTGTGILPILLCGKNKAAEVYGFEIQQEMADMAARSMAMNHLEDRVKILHEDCFEAPNILGRNSMDVVISNPPYGEFGKTMRNPEADREIARHQEPDTLDRFFKAAFLCLKGRGKLCLIYPIHGMFNVMETLKRNHLEPKRFRLVYPYRDKPANLVMIEGVKDAKPGLHAMPPLIVYEGPGQYTDELNTIYGLKPTEG